MQIDHRTRPVRNGSLSDKFWAKVAESGQCWIWTGTRDRAGYGRFSHRGEDSRLASPKAHRWSYEQLVGEIPTGLELDHLCRNRACVNPWHLEPVTHDENTRRGQFARRGSSEDACPNGHPRTPENRVQRSRPRGRSGECKACNRERMRNRRDDAAA